MAHSSEFRDQCAQIVFDTADVVREAILRQLAFRLRALPQVQAFRRAVFLCQLARWVAKAYLFSGYGDERLSSPVLIAQRWFEGRLCLHGHRTTAVVPFG